jgi:hypothetical protein
VWRVICNLDHLETRIGKSLRHAYVYADEFRRIEGSAS